MAPLIKSDSKDILNVTKDLMNSIKIVSSTTVFNIDNNQK